LCGFAGVINHLRGQVCGILTGTRGRNLPSTTVPLPSFPQRDIPLAMLHSKVARLKDAHATRTNRTARTSSTVSITTIGADQSINTIRVPRASANGLTSCKLLP